MSSSPAQSPLARSPSPSSPTNSISSNNVDDEILTPSRKVAALLATFDDSDSEDGNEDVSAVLARQRARINTETTRRVGEVDVKPGSKTLISRSVFKDGAADYDDEEEESDEDDLPVMPRGRMAARLQAAGALRRDDSELIESDIQTKESITEKDEVETKTSAVTEPVEEDEEDEDEIMLPRAKRMPKSRKAVISDDEDEVLAAPPSPPKAFEPLFFSSEENSPLPSRRRKARDSGSDSDLAQPADNSKFVALVARKRAERQAKEAEELKKKAERAALLKSPSDDIEDDLDDDEDDEADRRLTQRSKPTRRAGKKAMEEISRESQRLKRNMQLAHQARTVKKITKESFLARFKPAPAPAPVEELAPALSSSAPASDAEAQKENTTPPTSPPSTPEQRKVTAAMDLAMEPLAALPPAEIIDTGKMDFDNEDDAPAETTPMPKLDKGKGKALDQSTVMVPETILPPKRTIKINPALRVNFARNMLNTTKSIHDDDLEIVTSPSKIQRTKVFESLPPRKAAEAHSLLMLRGLAQLTSPSKTRNKRGPTSGELQVLLRQQARLQAQQERAEKLQELRDRGIIIQTAEEREDAEAEIEDLVEKARREGEELSKREKEAAKREGREVVDDGLDDSEDDGDYVGEEEEAEADVELSGSEEEGDEEEDAEIDAADGLIDDAAEETAESASEGEEEEKEEEETVQAAPVRRRNNNARIVSDDEDDEEEIIRQTPVTPAAPKTPRGFNIPGLGQHNEGISFGLTQAFASTALGSQPFLSQEDDQQDSMDMLSAMPDPGLPITDLEKVDSQEMVPDSQPEAGNLFSLGLLDEDSFAQRTRDIQDSPGMRTLTQYSQIPSASQDVLDMSPLVGRSFNFGTPAPMPQSTIDTVLIESPIAPRKGRLQQRRRAVDSDEEDDVDETSEATAFEVMRKAAAKAKKARLAAKFDKERSEAKKAVDEAAVESEDEYAGLGGASDEEYGEENEYDRMIIDDDKGLKVEERKLAALHADKERQQDEAQVSKLLKDITSGALRRKRGAGAGMDALDLDDSDDDMEARRRAKRREFAKMRKALLADEKIGKIAENPKKAAFLKSIQDVMEEDDDDDEGGFEEEVEFVQDSQVDGDVTPLSQDSVVAMGSQQDSGSDASALKRKRALHPSASDMANRPAPKIRRGAYSLLKAKPSSISEIRESVSFLIDDPHSWSNSKSGDISSDDGEEGEGENENDADENDESSNGAGNKLISLVTESSIELSDTEDSDINTINNNNNKNQLSKPPSRPHFSARRTNIIADKTSMPPPPPTTVRQTSSSTSVSGRKVVDRLSLLRAASSNSSVSASSSSGPRSAFVAITTGSSQDTSFRVPALLARRATGEFKAAALARVGSSDGNNNNSTNASSSSSKKNTASGGGVKSSVNYYAAAREKERAKELRNGGGGGGMGIGVGSEGDMKALLRKKKEKGNGGAGLGALMGGGGDWE